MFSMNDAFHVKLNLPRREENMNIKHLLRSALAAVALLVPAAAYAGGIQYVYASGGFTYTGPNVPPGPPGTLSGFELVNITDLSGNAIALNPPFTPFPHIPVLTNGPFKLSVTTSLGIVSGSLTDKLGATLFKFTGGTITVFQTAGNNAVFTVDGIHYSNVASQLDHPQYLPNGSVGSFTGSTTAWNGTTGKFNGNFSAGTPELGSSVAMATMLLGAGFLGFRKRR
jgi:hypothetical protein